MVMAAPARLDRGRGAAGIKDGIGAPNTTKARANKSTDALRADLHQCFTAGYSMNYNSADQAPDSDTNYQLRSILNSRSNGTGLWTTASGTGVGVPQMGVDSAIVVNGSTTNALLPSYSIYVADPDYPPNHVTQTNFTIEQPLPGNSALRLSYLYTHASNLDQNFDYNSHYSTYAWEVLTGTVPPKEALSGCLHIRQPRLGPMTRPTMAAEAGCSSRAAGRTTISSNISRASLS